MYQRKKEIREYNMQEIADMFGCTREMVRQYEKNALIKMKRYILYKRTIDPNFMTLTEFENLFKYV